MPGVVVWIGLALATSGALDAAGEPAGQGETPPDAKIDRLVERLGDDDYQVRQRAQDELAQLGFEACDALTVASDHDDLEIASRAKYLLRLMRVELVAQSDPPQVKSILRDYSNQSFDDRRLGMRRLAALPDGIGVPALCRLARFEKSVLLSKHAALEILKIEPVDETDRARLAETIQKNLGPSRRTAVAWLLADLNLSENPQKALGELADLVQAERIHAQHASRQSSRRIVTSLLYHLAAAHAARHDRKSADETAQEAREFFPRSQSAVMQFVQFHYETAMELRGRGWFAWAELEYGLVIETDLPEAAAIAQGRLAEMLHDQGEHQRAAETLEDTIGLIDQKKLKDTQEERTRLVGRMNYFRSRHWAEQGDLKKEREHVDRALEADPAELDALIARHKLPGVDAEYDRETLGLIEKAADGLVRQIQTSPEEPQNYNQFAWLVGNTKGDSDEALRCAKLAVEMSPASGAFFDTLAHVHFGRGELEAAVKYQVHAARLEPHSGLIVKQLAFFREKLKEKQAVDAEKKPTPPAAPDEKESNDQ